MTHPLTLDADLRFHRSEQRFRGSLPKTPGEPMRVQPSRARKPADENA
ncbi:hypothetical protein ACI79J_08405 [Geodermatophilus sp. SYSU D01062]